MWQGLMSVCNWRMECFVPYDRSHSSEEIGDHTCILSYESLKLLWSHTQVEPILLENHWRAVPSCKYKGWREYHYYKPKFSSLEEDVVLQKIRLPEPIEDAPKKDILKFVRTVNERAERNILCAWVHRGPKIAPSPSCSNNETSSSAFKRWKHGTAKVNSCSSPDPRCCGQLHHSDFVTIPVSAHG